MVALLVGLTIVTVLLAGGVVHYLQSGKRVGADAVVSARSPIRVEVPGGVFLSPQHTWAFLEPEGFVRIGVDSLIATLAGSVDSVSLPAPGHKVRAGEALFTLGQGKKKLALRSPIEGTVTRLNPELESNPETLVDRSYRSWVCEMDCPEFGRDIGKMRIGIEALNWLKAEARRIQDFIPRFENAASIGAVAQDGGFLSKGALQLCGEEAWIEFERKFLGEVTEATTSAGDLNAG